MCGTTKGPFVDNLCESCYMKEHELDIETISKLEVELCPICYTIKIKGTRIETWKQDEAISSILRNIVRQVILENIRGETPLSYEIEDNITEDQLLNRGVKEFYVLTTVTAQPHEAFSSMKKELSTTVKIVRRSCPECTKYKAKYFEAILQIRGTRRNLTEKEKEEVEKIIDGILKQHEEAKMTYLIDYKVDKKGITTKVSTKYLAETLAREIKNKMAGKMTVAYQLKTTAKDGSEIYTNTYLVKLPYYAVDDIVEYETKMWRVLKVKERQIIMESLENHEIKNLDRVKIEKNGKKRTEEVIEREYMILALQNDTAIIMGMDNYENYEERREKLPKSKQYEGQNIKGFLLEEKNYYIE
ncbi:MAG: NMD3-related protein [Candidatus Heimdallarchaeaceae archaeon]